MGGGAADFAAGAKSGSEEDESWRPDPSFDLATGGVEQESGGIQPAAEQKRKRPGHRGGKRKQKQWYKGQEKKQEWAQDSWRSGR